MKKSLLHRLPKFGGLVAACVLATSSLSAQLVLDPSKAWFSDNFESGVRADKWNLAGSAGSNRVVSYGEADPQNASNKTYFISMERAGSGSYKTTTVPWTDKPPSYGYGVSLDFYIPTTEETTLANADFGRLTVFRGIGSTLGESPTSGNWPYIAVTHPDANGNTAGLGTTDTTFTLQAFASKTLTSSVGQQFLTLERGVWHTIQIDHVGGTRAEGGLEVYINGELWVYLGNNNNTNIVLTRIELAAQNNDDGGAIYYDNVLAAPAVVPEPASAALLTGVITGLGVLACKRRVRR